MGKRPKNLEDAYKWSKETVEALRIGNFSAIDTDALVDEIESIASGLERALGSTLRDILEALLWKQYTNGRSARDRQTASTCSSTFTVAVPIDSKST